MEDLIPGVGPDPDPRPEDRWMSVHIYCGSQ